MLGSGDLGSATRKLPPALRGQEKLPSVPFGREKLMEFGAHQTDADGVVLLDAQNAAFLRVSPGFSRDCCLPVKAVDCTIVCCANCDPPPSVMKGAISLPSKD